MCSCFEQFDKPPLSRKSAGLKTHPVETTHFGGPFFHQPQVRKAAGASISPTNGLVSKDSTGSLRLLPLIQKPAPRSTLQMGRYLASRSNLQALVALEGQPNSKKHAGCPLVLAHFNISKHHGGPCQTKVFRGTPPFDGVNTSTRVNTALALLLAGCGSMCVFVLANTHLFFGVFRDVCTVKEYASNSVSCLTAGQQHVRACEACIGWRVKSDHMLANLRITHFMACRNRSA